MYGLGLPCTPRALSIGPRGLQRSGTVAKGQHETSYATAFPHLVDTKIAGDYEWSGTGSKCRPSAFQDEG